ncbi:AAA family ATPase [Mycobacterium yunnanensis]|uniref:AAA family ATPase n=1 Tax=Mycobacterium yunnanensis TaxID=368477 RepID=A0A9X3BSH7_9MYCO|nr:AAA family ATPase [Mycobacterium yunnanensis]MCV7420619.1 AAA family ATPase [Mycobacterium yunnanensis]
MLTAADPVTWQPQRIAIAGVTGSGKSTLAKRISSRLDLTYVEIDGLYHGPNWEPRRDFVRDVEAVISGDSWVVEWQYTAVRAKILERADTLIWLDLPTPLTLYQLTRRTVRRRLRKIELWNGNYEGPLLGFLTDPDHIVRWGIRTRNKLRDRVPALTELHPSLRVVRLASRADIELWVSRLSTNSTW